MKGPFSGSKWNADLKPSQYKRSLRDPMGSGSDWKAEERNKKAADKKERKAERKARRR